MNNFLSKSLLLYFLLLILSCRNKGGELTIGKDHKGDSIEIVKIYREIDSYPQTDTPHRVYDKKILAIKKLIGCNNGGTPDTLKKIFLNIDTTIANYYQYQSAVLETLVKIYSKESLSTFGKIIGNNPVSPNTAKSLYYGNLLDKTDSVKYLFPELAKGLISQPFDQNFIICLMTWGVQRGHVKKEDLFSSKKYLLEYLKAVENAKMSNETSKASYITEVIYALRIFKRDTSLYPLYQSTLVNNLKPGDFNDKDIDYHNFVRHQVELLLNASLALIENDQNVEEVYLEKICKDPFYRFELYNQLSGLDKKHLFPKKYLNQYYFAESDLIQKYAKSNGGGYYPDNLERLGKIALRNGSKPGNYYLFKVKYSEDGKRYGNYISGPQPLDSTKAIRNGYLTYSTIGDDIDKEDLFLFVADKIRKVNKYNKDREDTPQ